MECTAVLLGVLRRAVLSVGGLRNRNGWRDGEFGEHWWAGGEAGWPGERQGKGGGSPARYMGDPFIF